MKIHIQREVCLCSSVAVNAYFKIGLIMPVYKYRKKILKKTNKPLPKKGCLKFLQVLAKKKYNLDSLSMAPSSKHFELTHQVWRQKLQNECCCNLIWRLVMARSQRASESFISSGEEASGFFILFLSNQLWMLHWSNQSPWVLQFQDFSRWILCSSETAANCEGEQLAFSSVILFLPKKEDELVKQNQCCQRQDSHSDSLMAQEEKKKTLSKWKTKPNPATAVNQGLIDADKTLWVLQE